MGLLELEDRRGKTLHPGLELQLDRETAAAVRRSGDARIEARWSHTEMGHAYRGG